MAKKQETDSETEVVELPAETLEDTAPEAQEPAPTSPDAPLSEPEADRMGVDRDVPELETEEGEAVDEATQEPVSEAKSEVAEKNRALKYEEQEDLLGDLEPGDEGYLPLTEVGDIAGPAQKEKPAKGQNWARVISPAESRRPLLMTPSGSPILKRMNPDPESTD